MRNQNQSNTAPSNDPDYINDEHWGKGGRYIFDPATGIRTPVTSEDVVQPVGETGGEPASE